MNLRVPNDLAKAVTEEFNRQRKVTSKVSEGSVFCDWARKGAIALGVPLEAVQPVEDKVVSS